VKKIWALIMAVHLFSGNVLMAEIGKLPFLWQHFFQHQKSRSGVSVQEFLIIHYSKNRHRQSDLEHHHLPLVSLHVAPAAPALQPECMVLLFQTVLVASRGSLLPLVKQPVSSGFKGRLLKPPAIYG
jgi:hypothetical protein